MSSYKIPRLNLLPVRPVKAKKLKEPATPARYLNRALWQSRFGLILGIVNLCLLIALGSMIWLHHRSLHHYNGLLQELTRQKDLLNKELDLVKTDLNHTGEALRSELNQLDTRNAQSQTHLNTKLKKLAADIARLEKRQFYLVKEGETLQDISVKIYGHPGKAQQIMELNRLKNAAGITAGDLLLIQK